ncbi:hypothetical protein M422DRAFT_33363 [Sphaerobolus stellatus SS14]|uniref:Uncharacterized protein n=1 Tax=Sphaerobolus stellatus (strain SS14) TaxID=990650 RepID=A0A0C9VKD4_SPHS4|nr:hypothetical protein M422DRAFT_33363 [Sphaerobolus stellatus SS14]
MKDCSVSAILDGLDSAGSSGNLEELDAQATVELDHGQTQIPLPYGMESNVTLSVPAEEREEPQV